LPDIDPKPIIEALLFATNEPLPASKMADLIPNCDGRAIRKSVLQLQKEYDETGRGFAIQEVAGGFQLLTRETYAEYIRKLHKTYAHARLSQAALETLAVIAYKQPVLRAEIDAIRGVNSGPLLRSLIDRGLVKIVGRADTLGRPVLYGTTKKFLERFLLSSLKELPEPDTIEAIQRENAEAAVPVEEGAAEGEPVAEGEAAGADGQSESEGAQSEAAAEGESVAVDADVGESEPTAEDGELVGDGQAEAVPAEHEPVADGEWDEPPAEQTDPWDTPPEERAEAPAEPEAAPDVGTEGTAPPTESPDEAGLPREAAGQTEPPTTDEPEEVAVVQQTAESEVPAAPPDGEKDSDGIFPIDDLKG